MRFLIFLPLVSAYTGYDFRTSGVSCNNIQDNDECTQAGSILGLAGPSEPVTAGNKPPGCLYDLSGLRFNDYASTFECSDTKKCICKTEGLPACPEDLVQEECACLQGGAGQTCQTNQICTQGVCSDPPPCLYQDGTQANTGACVCGDQVCAMSDLYCDGSCSQNPTLQVCQSIGGSQTNSACMCGSVQCEEGDFCDQEKSSCSKIPGLHQIQTGTLPGDNEFCTQGDQLIETQEECTLTAARLNLNLEYYTGDTSITEFDQDMLPQGCSKINYQGVDYLHFNPKYTEHQSTIWQDRDCNYGLADWCICKTLVAPLCTETGDTPNVDSCFCGEDACLDELYCIDQCSAHPICAENEKAFNSQCIPCDPGLYSEAGTNPLLGDTECQPIVCQEDFRVLDYACIECEVGKSNAPGDLTSQETTECDTIICQAGERVFGHICVTCQAGKTTPGGDPATGEDTLCLDIDECQGVECNGECTNGDNQYECTCATGYEGGGVNQVCTNIDECANGACSPNAICEDTQGSYECTCKEGYTGDGETCQDVDECLQNPCIAEAECTNTEGSHTCTCKEGYSGDGETCQDIDECLGNPCIPQAQCSNTEGSYTCTCQEGYSGDGETCQDIDECLGDPCIPQAQCTNTEGSHQCTCKEGYSGDGETCQDVDECLQNPCIAEADCTNTEGSYTCTCSPGLQGDGTVCQLVPCQENHYVSGNSCTPCPENHERDAGDDPTGEDTACTHRGCASPALYQRYGCCTSGECECQCD